MGGVRMEAIFEYEISGVVYPEDDPPQQFVDALLNALKSITFPSLKKAE
jgi:hypothetical protein